MDRGGLHQRRRATACLVALAVLAGGCTGADDPEPAVEGDVAPASDLLQVTDLKDGDSFVASDGEEYRVGLVNTPELSACGGPAAADVTAALLVDGFTAEAYATDQHGRSVARITTAEGTDLGVTLAVEGYADDRYLEQFRHENPGYAAELDEAFADARAEGAGLWGTCWAATATPTPTPRGGPTHTGRTGEWTCHPDYRECIPDGPDLDCVEVGHQVALLGQADPYRLDGNSTTRTDGIGCDTYPAWEVDVVYPYYG